MRLSFPHPLLVRSGHVESTESIIVYVSENLQRSHADTCSISKLSHTEEKNWLSLMDGMISIKLNVVERNNWEIIGNLV